MNSHRIRVWEVSDGTFNDLVTRCVLRKPQLQGDEIGAAKRFRPKGTTLSPS
jgi:hypothetical protein